MSSRATKGKVTKIVARTIAGKCKGDFDVVIPRSQGPSQPCIPKIRIKTRPETTGETEKGMSISAVRSVLPRKSNLATAQAAAMPKIMLAGTAMAATSSVKLDRRQRIGIFQRVNCRREPVLQRGREHHDERQDKEQRDEGNRQDGESPARKPAVRGRSAISKSRFPVHRRASIQSCKPLSRSNVRNEIASMTTPIAAAPA